MPINELVAGDLAGLDDLPDTLSFTSAVTSAQTGGKICCGCSTPLCDESRCYCCCCG
jgi:hypothetical protein